MFTGIVEETGRVLEVGRREGGRTLAVSVRRVCEGSIAGDSIAVNGCCLTVTSNREGHLAFDLLEETCRLTNLGDLEPGAAVNLERSLPVGGRLGGHFVTGHIDHSGKVAAVEAVRGDLRMEISVPVEFARYLAYKGCIAVDGVSLTVAEAGKSGFVVWLIPHTLAETNLGQRQPGDRVNLEFDLLAKYVERLRGGAPAGA